MRKKIQCSRCGEKMSWGDWQVHKCKNLRSLSEMPTYVLMQLAKKQITETEAWAIVDQRATKAPAKRNTRR